MSTATFEERYDERIAEAMLEHGSPLGGLPAYLGIQIVRLASGKLWARAVMQREAHHTVGQRARRSGRRHSRSVTGAVVYPLMPPGCRDATTSLPTWPPLGAGTVRRANPTDDLLSTRSSPRSTVSGSPTRRSSPAWCCSEPPGTTRPMRGARGTRTDREPGPAPVAARRPVIGAQRRGGGPGSLPSRTSTHGDEEHDGRRVPDQERRQACASVPVRQPR